MIRTALRLLQGKTELRFDSDNPQLRTGATSHLRSFVYFYFGNANALSPNVGGNFHELL
jgi:hypothetical protein